MSPVAMVVLMAVMGVFSLAQLPLSYFFGLAYKPGLRHPDPVARRRAARLVRLWALVAYLPPPVFLLGLWVAGQMPLVPALLSSGAFLALYLAFRVAELIYGRS